MLIVIKHIGNTENNINCQVYFIKISEDNLPDTKGSKGMLNVKRKFNRKYNSKKLHPYRLLGNSANQLIDHNTGSGSSSIQ